MNTEEKEEKLQKAKSRKLNMKIFPIYSMFGTDFVFYYAIQVLFLYQVKNISEASIVLASSVYAFATILVQIPALIIVDKIGKKKALLIGNILNATCMAIILFCPNFIVFLLEECLSSIAFALKSITEPSILNNSIPECTRKGEIFSNINSKGYAKFCYLSAFSAIIAGILYDINPYIPIVISLICSIIALLISRNFSEIKNENLEKEETTKKRENKDIENYIQDLKRGFRFIFHSKRLRALLLMVGFLWGLTSLFITYKVSLLNDLAVSATLIGIFDAIYQIFVGLSSRYATTLNKKLKNKTLTVIAFGHTVGFILCGIVALVNIPFIIKLTVLAILYLGIGACKGLSQILKKQYMNNFATEEVFTKIYTTESIISNLSKMIIGLVGSAILSNFNIKYSIIIVGAIFSILGFVLYEYMKTRVGLKPEEYPKEDLEIL